MTLCSGLPSRDPNFPMPGTGWITFFSTLILLLSILGDRVLENKLKALKARNAELTHSQSQLQERVIQLRSRVTLFGDKVDLQRILLGHSGTGRPLCVEIDGVMNVVVIYPVTHHPDGGVPILRPRQDDMPRMPSFENLFTAHRAPVVAYGDVASQADNILWQRHLAGDNTGPEPEAQGDLLSQGNETEVDGNMGRGHEDEEHTFPEINPVEEHWMNEDEEWINVDKICP